MTTKEICADRSNGAMCTLPKGHSGDHVAASGTQDNIHSAWRADEDDD